MAPLQRRNIAARMLWLLAAAVATSVALSAVQAGDLLAEARALTYRIKSAQSRAAAFAELAVRYDAAGNSEADRLWQLALECPLAVDDPLARVLAQRAVLQRMLLVAARREEASRLAADVAKAAGKLPAPTDRALALRELALTVARAFPEMARRALEASARAGGEIPEAAVRASALAQTAGAMAETGLGDARAVVEAAAEAWQAAEPSVERDLVGVEVVRAAARAEPARARKLVEAISDVQVKARALTALGEALAAEDVGRALLAVREIADPSLRALALAGVARRLAKGDAKLAARVAREALRAADGHRAAPIRELVVASAAVAMAPAAPDRARELIRSISDHQLRAEAMASAARLVAPANAKAAAEMLQAADAPEITEPAWPEVLYWYAQTDADEARRLAGHILERYLRVRALLRIWDAVVGGAHSGRGAEKQ